MKRIFSVPVIGANGRTLVDKDGNPQLLSGMVAVGMFNLSELNGAAVSPETKLKAWKIVTKMQAVTPGEPVELDAEELKLIDDVMGKAFTAGVDGQVKMIIEND